MDASSDDYLLWLFDVNVSKYLLRKSKRKNVYDTQSTIYIGCEVSFFHIDYMRMANNFITRNQ